jgi:hypothetical protein
MRPAVFLILLFFINETKGNVLPKDQAILNYTRIYFEDDLVADAGAYELFVYKNASATRTANIVYTARNNMPAFLVPDFEWGKTYYWEIKAYNKKGMELSPARLHSFTTVGISSNRISDVRFDVKTNKEDEHAGGLISVDYARSILNRRGKVVWTLPNIPGVVDSATQIRNLSITKDNTLLFLTLKRAVEINMHGDVMWKAPEKFVFNKDTLMYHHDFKKTNRGTYMVLANRPVLRKVTGPHMESQNRENEVFNINGVPHRKALVDILLEFDGNGKVIWYWDANNYITDEDFNFKKDKDGYARFSAHGNAFSENHEGTKVYIGFRDLSRIIKIDKATKKVELSYGEKYPSGDPKFANGLFRNQHDAGITNHNSILIFNNYVIPNEGGTSSILELRDNVTDIDSVLLWKFDLNFDTLSDGRSLSQGNVTELPDSNLLVCAGVLNRVFEVTKKKEVVWDAFILYQEKRSGAWKPSPNYRCNWIADILEYHVIPEITSPAVLESGTLKLEMLLHNTGNADDSYLVEIYSGNKLVHKVKTTRVEKGQELTQSISVKLPPGSKNLEAKISSLSSPVTVKMPVKM